MSAGGLGVGWDAGRRTEEPPVVRTAHGSALVPLGPNLWRAGWSPVPSAFSDAGAEGQERIEEGSWFVVRAGVVEDVLRRHRCHRVLDVGAGSGALAARLRAHGFDVVAVEPGPAGARACAARGVPTVLGTLEALGLRDGSEQAVGLFDVVEHLADPVPTLVAARRALCRGGRLVLTVPAHRWLWSDTDVRAGHVRRFGRSGLTGLLRSCGLVPVEVRHLFPLAVPAVFAVRVVGFRLGRAPDAGPDGSEFSEADARRLARRSALLDRFYGTRSPFPVGTSLLAVARPA